MICPCHRDNHDRAGIMAAVGRRPLSFAARKARPSTIGSHSGPRRRHRQSQTTNNSPPDRNKGRTGRRCTGRQAASPSLVLRRSVRIIAGLGTRGRCFQGRELAPRKIDEWPRLRHNLEERRRAGMLRYRFRRDSAAYLRELEALALKHPLPP